jgi:hypothetical protein
VSGAVDAPDFRKITKTREYKSQVSLLAKCVVQVMYPWLAIDVHESVIIAKCLFSRIF